jgi:hypothetical protein
MFGCGLRQPPPEEVSDDAKISVEKEWEITGTTVELSKDGKWLRAVQYSLFVPVSALSSVRVRPSIDRHDRTISYSGEVYLEIVIQNPDLRKTEVAGIEPPKNRIVYTWIIVSDVMEYAKAAEFMTRLTGFEISPEVPPRKGPVMP